MDTLSVTPPFVDGLYRELLQHGISYFFPHSRLEFAAAVEPGRPVLTCRDLVDGGLDLEWLGVRYVLRKSAGAVTNAERDLLCAIGRVLATRYDRLASPPAAAHTFQLFRGLPEDCYVSSYLEALASGSTDSSIDSSDRVADAIEVLRASALGTYENRRIAMGVLLFGSQADP
jgi:hypothetical protein